MVAGGMNEDGDVVRHRIDGRKFYPLGDWRKEISNISPVSKEWLTRRVNFNAGARQKLNRGLTEVKVRIDRLQSLVDHGSQNAVYRKVIPARENIRIGNKVVDDNGLETDLASHGYMLDDG